MRQLFLVVVLITASFLGGAFVNGPGLQWAQTRIFRSLGLNNGGEIASIDLKPSANSETDADKVAPVKSEIEKSKEPLAPMPSLFTEGKSAKVGTSDQPSVLESSPKSSTNRPTSAKSRLSSSSDSVKRPAANAKSRGRQSDLSDTRVTPVAGENSQITGQAPARSDADISPAILDSLTNLFRADTPSPGSHLPSLTSPSLVSGTSARPAAHGNDHWKVLECKMQSLGVSRYTMEGEPGGRVMFSCLIPVAGRQAVAQRFEADGEDIEHAAEAALRRITLWRATQPASP